MIHTRIFGDIEVDANKIITFDGGIIGFPELKRFMLIHDRENEKKHISWLQSIDEPDFAMPVIDPLKLVEDYNPIVEDELLSGLGKLSPEEMLVLVTMTIPKDITKMTVNLKAPIIINAASLKAGQIIVDDEKYVVRYPIYDILKSKKEG
ncbi:MAG: flagellar assembly protein FliW [Lachnospiraceae bacterium]